MQRMTKSFSQIKGCCSKNSRGFLSSYLFSVERDVPVLFSSTRPTGKPFPPPSFHVPAIIDALRESSCYHQLVHLVPGEADSYCAQHLLKSGGTVLTSDSDLLAHDLGQGQVTFLRDIHVDTHDRLSCASFSSSQICKRLGISSSQICRLAYERKCSPHSTLPQILRDCSQTIKDPIGYEEFCHEYLDHESASLPFSKAGSPTSVDGVDPRISEFILQMGPAASKTPDDIKMFLPILLESSSRGSAWEQSTPLRQLAYTIARWIIPGSASDIQEYRRVNTLDQKGRLVCLLPQEAAKTMSKQLINLMTQVRVQLKDATLHWQVFCLSLDIRYCYEEGKHSHMLQSLRDSIWKRDPSRISWDTIHLVAQLQASYYSLRMLKQVLTLAPSETTIPELCDLLTSLPPLRQSPDIEGTMKLLLRASEPHIMKSIARLVPLPASELPCELKKPNKRKSPKENGTAAKRVTSNPASRNLFDLLLQDS